MSGAQPALARCTGAQPAPRQAARLRYHDLPGEGVPLLFLHGLGSASSSDFGALARDPALSGRRRILFDLLGSGNSDQPTDFGYTVDDHARVLDGLIGKIAPGQVDLFGHGMGGTIAVVLAERLGERVRHLLLAEPQLDAGGDLWSRRISRMSEGDYVTIGQDDLVIAALRERRPVWAGSLSVSAPWAVHREARALAAGGDPPWRQRLEALKLPRSVFFGAGSLPDPQFDSLDKSGIPVEVIADAGHFIAIDNPAGLAAALAAALAR